ncbi:MAG TPA: hypothetical protein P5307_10320 [Pirellulaceae bacterium]|nr:hypothetical protein [Pirellulaceae bacterium]
MFDVNAIREQLNELAFEDGRRVLSLGVVSELFPDAAPAHVEIELASLAERLKKRDLILERRPDQPQELYVVQKLKYRDTDLTWLAKGMEWVSKITTVALEMVVPAVIGSWLDQHLETSFLGVLGLVVGVPLGIWHLVKMTKN